MTPIEIELQHLMKLMAEPFRENWKAYCWDKAQRLAEIDADQFAALPALLKEAMLKGLSGSIQGPPSTEK